MQQCLERAGHGKVLFGIDLATEPDAIARLLELKDSFLDTLEFRLFGSREKSEFHAKFAIFLHHKVVSRGLSKLIPSSTTIRFLWRPKDRS